MNIKATLILVVVFVLCLVAFLITRGQADPSTPTPARDTAQRDDTEPVIEPARLGTALQRLTFDFGKDGVELELVRRAGRWRVTHPHDFPTNPRAIDEVLTRLGNLPGKPDGEPAGPTPDALALELAGTDFRIRLELGPRLGAGRASITRMIDGRADSFETNDELHELFDYFDTTLFFARKIDAPLMPETARLEIVTADQHVVLAQARGRWMIGTGDHAERALEKGLPGYVGIEDYFALLPALDILEHRAYAPGDGLARFGLEQPLIEVRFTPIGTDEPLPQPATVLRVGVPADPQDQSRFVSYGRLGDPSPAVFVTPTPLALAFAQAGSTFRDPRLITTPITLIQAIHIDLPGLPTRTLSIRPEGSASLTVGDDAGLAVNPQACIDTLIRLIDTRATGYVDLDGGGSSPIATLRLSARLDGDDERLSVFADPESKPSAPTVLVRRADEPVALRVAEASIASLLEPERMMPRR